MAREQPHTTAQNLISQSIDTICMMGPKAADKTDKRKRMTIYSSYFAIHTEKKDARLNVFMVVMILIMFFRVKLPCGLVGRNQCHRINPI
jgi:hypothetical protein